MHPEQTRKQEALQPESTELAAIAAMTRDLHGHLRLLAQQHAELTLFQQIFEQAYAAHQSKTTSQEVSALLFAFESALLHIKSIINPTGLPLDVTPDGRIRSRTFRSAAVISTDLQDFTPFTLDVPRVTDTDVFDVLSYTYYPHMMEILKKHDCHLYSFAGDGTMILSREKLAPDGRVLLPALENAVLCVAETNLVLSIVADAWKELRLHNADGSPKRTRFGVKFGSVTIGDALAPDASPEGMCAKFNEIFREIVKTRAPMYGPPVDFSQLIWGVHGISPVQNHAARLQSSLADTPDYFCALTLEDVQQLCAPLQKLFSKPTTRKLKGIDYDMSVCGLAPLTSEQIADLARECQDYYQTHQTYH